MMSSVVLASSLFLLGASAFPLTSRQANCNLLATSLVNQPISIQWYFNSVNPDTTFLAATYPANSTSSPSIAVKPISASLPNTKWTLKTNTGNKWDQFNIVQSGIPGRAGGYCLDQSSKATVFGKTCQDPAPSNAYHLASKEFFYINCQYCSLPGGKAANCQILSVSDTSKCIEVQTAAGNSLKMMPCVANKHEQLFGFQPTPK